MKIRINTIKNFEKHWYIKENKRLGEKFLMNLNKVYELNIKE